MINQAPPAESICQAKPASIFKRVWPAIMLAKRRIDKLKTRATYETVSISIIKGLMAGGQPGGKNIAKNPMRCMRAPMMFMPTKLASAIEKVAASELVTVKL